MSDLSVPPPPPEPERDPWAGATPWSPGPPQPPAGVAAYASWGQRVGAVLLDGLLSSAAVFVVFLVASIVGGALGLLDDTLGAVVGGLVGLTGYVAILIVLVLTGAAPYGQTPGKHIVGIRVVDTSGHTISKGLAVARYFSTILSALPCYLGFLWPLWDPEKRTFHDMVVNTRVVSAVGAAAPSLTAILQAPFNGPVAGTAPPPSPPPSPPPPTAYGGPPS